ncbi:MAG: ISKra4 family transposase [Myxococcota bacterium]
MSRAQLAVVENPFDGAERALGALTERLQGAEARAMSHGQVEALIHDDGMKILRQLLQGHIDLRGLGDVGPVVVGSDGVERRHRDVSTRRLESVFGEVSVTRLGYRMPGVETLFPLDAELNLPPELYSHGVQRRTAVLVAKTSFDEAVSDIAETTGASVPKRQAEQLAARAAVDFDDFYAEREGAARTGAATTSDILVMSADGKGVVMRKEDLRPATRKAAETRKHKLEKRVSKGEKRNAKRMATVAAVYTVSAHQRTPEDIVHELRSTDAEPRPKRPRPEYKRVWASLSKTPEQVIDEAFLEGLRRDPERKKTWVGLVDGNKTQIKLLKAGAKRYALTLVILLDVIHVIEYLWRAARVLHEETSKEAEQWVNERLLAILRGQSSAVAAGMRRSATNRGLAEEARKPVDTCANYLLKYRQYLRYDVALEAGFPIATGIIEGACRHLVKDRMDLTGARWSLTGAEAVLRLRSLRASHDFDDYWPFHEARERESQHDVRYDGAIVPPPLPVPPRRHAPPDLRVIHGGK